QYGTMDAQMNMVCDFERTKRYQEAIQGQRALLDGSVVMDVGSGTGILSVFCCRAGARRVYAVEASAAMNIMQHLLAHNEPFYRERIIGIHDKLENIHELPENGFKSACAGAKRGHELDVLTSIGGRDRAGKGRGNCGCLAKGPSSPGASLEPVLQSSMETKDLMLAAEREEAAEKQPIESEVRGEVGEDTDPEQAACQEAGCEDAVNQSSLCVLASSQNGVCHTTKVYSALEPVETATREGLGEEGLMGHSAPGPKQEVKPVLVGHGKSGCEKSGHEKGTANVVTTSDEPVEEPVVRNKSKTSGLHLCDGVETVGKPLGKVDVIVSEPMGICLVSEGMMKTLLVARDRFLRPGGSIIPRKASVYVGLTSNSYYGLYISRESQLWRQKNMYGLDWRSLHTAAIHELLVRPVIMDVDDLVSEYGCESVEENVATRPSSSKPSSPQLGKRRRVCVEQGNKSNGEACVSGGGGWQDFRLKSESYQQSNYGAVHFDLLTCPSNSFDEIPICFTVGPLSNDVTLTAFVVWFDVELAAQVVLSTHPFAPRTHWHQTAFILERPILLEAGETLTATFHMRCRDRSYDCQGKLYKDDICIGKTLVCPLKYAVQV
ncbi:putative arginine N-methyltransferase, partial [Gregarina niphandrodes]